MYGKKREQQNKLKQNDFSQMIENISYLLNSSIKQILKSSSAYTKHQRHAHILTIDLKVRGYLNDREYDDSDCHATIHSGIIMFWYQYFVEETVYRDITQLKRVKSDLQIVSLLIKCTDAYLPTLNFQLTKCSCLNVISLCATLGQEWRVSN